ncbi:hypothetical protein AQUCO_06100026v1 [Aquilegia coerulea]|uniref:Uncharacterized protein n=1 Tax=Aquilegia coerulea TaxID=218851 RepID=A0A2G5CD87_AQUCA|nr:hypothetical protein AQUCO_06100026v1 [Aquilegia coerulea]
MVMPKSIRFVLFVFLFMAAKALSIHCSENERNALLSFKHGLTNGTIALSSWVGQDCCKWEGVNCDDFSGHVIQLYLTGNYLQGEISASLGELSSLEELHFSFNYLSGQIPMSIGRLPNLTVLSFASNRLSGQIPKSFGRLSNLETLDLSSNKLNGSVPEFLGQLSKLTILNLNDNSFSGVVSELHFKKLSKLVSLYLGGNSLSLNITSGWVPPFQLEYLDLGSCDVGTLFPAWLRTQSSLSYLVMSNAGISDSIPHWFLNLTSNTEFLDLSRNQIYGKLPSFVGFQPDSELILSSNKFEGSLPIFPSDLMVLDLTNNKISGIIPEDMGLDGFSIKSLSLSNNCITGTIPSSLCKLGYLEFLDLSKNHLSGHLPQCLSELDHIIVMDLASNNLKGTIPSSFFQLSSLTSLHLSKNKFHGELPSSLQNCQNLSLLDLGDNFLSGEIPTWIGERLPYLEILGLRSNKFNGTLSPKLCYLNELRILDVANNNLSGTIPRCFDNFSAMVFGYIHLRPNPLYYDDDSSFQVIKGRELEYSKELLHLVSNMDLSDNNLVGQIPEELTNLSGLIGLNLSGNNLIGSIPKRIGQMKSMQSLDLSMNHLSGVIPPSISSLFGLSYLNLSHNNLSGEIPSGNQLQTLYDPCIYNGNSELCGYPLQKKCTGDHKPPQIPVSSVDQKQDDKGIDFITIWFYSGMASGFVAGFCGVWGILFFKKTWRYAYFGFVDDTGDMIYVAIVTRINRLKRN